MTKIVYNACYGGFGLSHEAKMRYAKLKGMTLYAHDVSSLYTIYTTVPYDEYCVTEEEDLVFSDIELARTDPVLVQVVEELGDKANGDYAKLCIAELPAGTLYRIDEYDGVEQVCTHDDYVWSVA